MVKGIEIHFTPYDRATCLVSIFANSSDIQWPWTA